MSHGPGLTRQQQDEAIAALREVRLNLERVAMCLEPVDNLFGPIQVLNALKACRPHLEEAKQWIGGSGMLRPEA